MTTNNKKHYSIVEKSWINLYDSVEPLKEPLFNFRNNTNLARHMIGLTDKEKAYQKVYQKAYRKTDKYKAYNKAYRTTDKYKAYKKAYDKAYYLKHKDETDKN